MARVLVVEDNPRLNTLALKVLCGHGHQVEQAADGATGVELALAKRPDVVLMDISLPGMDGLEATRRIKLACPDLPVAALTAHAMPSDRERALEAGCDCVITKPYAIADLLACVERLAARSVPAAAVPAQDGTA